MDFSFSLLSGKDHKVMNIQFETETFSKIPVALSLSVFNHDAINSIISPIEMYQVKTEQKKIT